jgi:hypothetical protein
MTHGGVHRLGRPEHFGHDQLVAAEQVAPLLMPAISGPLMMSGALAPRQLPVEIGNQSVADAFDDAARRRRRA